MIYLLDKYGCTQAMRKCPRDSESPRTKRHSELARNTSEIRTLCLFVPFALLFQLQIPDYKAFVPPAVLLDSAVNLYPSSHTHNRRRPSLQPSGNLALLLLGIVWLVILIHITTPRSCSFLCSAMRGNLVIATKTLRL